jgi:hypothetical protein
LRVYDDHVAAGLDHRVVGAERLAPQLGERDVEVGEVVRVEDDPLRVALVVADAQAVDEWSRVRPPGTRRTRRA